MAPSRLSIRGLLYLEYFNQSGGFSFPAASPVHTFRIIKNSRLRIKLNLLKGAIKIQFGRERGRGRRENTDGEERNTKRLIFNDSCKKGGERMFGAQLAAEVK